MIDFLQYYGQSVRNKRQYKILTSSAIRRGRPPTSSWIRRDKRDIETGYDYFGARYYDSRISRWLSVDPLADKYPGWSPYNYALNNPLRYIDQHGDSVWVYAERLGSETFSNGNRNWLEATIGYLSRPDHSIIRIKTNDVDKTIEFTGKGEVLFKNTDLNSQPLKSGTN